MTDRELLEMAAKAAGFGDPEKGRVTWTESEYPPKSGKYGCLWNFVGYMDTAQLWNPLTDDGDALRLAIKLRMAVDVNVCFVDVAWCNYVLSEMYDLQEDWGDGDVGCEVKIAATRRAIVRAAAEIGKHAA